MLLSLYLGKKTIWDYICVYEKFGDIVIKKNNNLTI